MVPTRGTLVRVFDGSLADAKGLLRVERLAFDESPYSAGEVQAMLAGGPQRAWLAAHRDEIIGFIIAFPTHRLEGSWWEMDLLAVDPAWAGRGLGRRLIRAAASGGSGLTDRARAVVATDNTASARAFAKAGFQMGPETHRLLIYRTGGLSSRPSGARCVDVEETTDPAEALEWLADSELDGVGSLGCPVPKKQAPRRAHAPVRDPDSFHPGYGPGSACLLAKKEERMTGFAEVVAVQTLLYSGLWIESLVAPEIETRRALIEYVLERTKAGGLDEVGAMLAEDNWSLQQDLLAEGFRSLGDFHWYTADLPLPGLTSMGSRPLGQSRRSLQDGT